MNKPIKRKIRDKLNGFMLMCGWVGIALVGAFISIGRSPGCYLLVMAAIIMPILFIYIFLELFIIFRYPLKAHIFTFYNAFTKWIFGFSFYLASINIVVFLAQHSVSLKIWHVSLLTFGYWWVHVYLRYLFLPRKFTEKEGFQQAIENRTLDPEKAILDIDVEWTNEVVYSKSQKSETLMTRRPTLYAIILGLGIFGLNLFSVEEVTKVVFFGAFTGVLSIVLNATFASSWHDHALVRQWEKANGRTLKIKL